MSMPYTFYEAALQNGEQRRERSLARHKHLMHLPQRESLLRRLVDRLRRKASSAPHSEQRVAAGEQVNTNRPPAFSG